MLNQDFELNSGTQNFPYKDEDTNLLRILVYTTNGVFSGYVIMQKRMRLLDALNQGFATKQLEICTEFLPLHGADVSYPDEDIVHMDTVFISMKSVLFVGELDVNTSITLSGHFPLRHKKSVKTIIKLPGLGLTGSTYSEVWEELQDSLCRTDRFVPVTDVEFKPRLDGGVNKLDFVAVNTDHIIFIGAK